MRVTKLVTGMLAVALLAPLAAWATPTEPWNPLDPFDELNLYEIYNDLYGTAFTSNSDLDPFEVSPDDVFVLPDGQQETLNVRARYAYLNHNFGWYEVNPDLSVGAMHELFSNMFEYGYINGTYEATITPGDLYGYYLEAYLPNNAAVGWTWYTQSMWNIDQQDHAILYSTPLDGVYMMAWEDVALGHTIADWDYQDLVLEVRRSVVPEPATITLLGLGAAAMAVRGLRKKVA